MGGIRTYVSLIIAANPKLEAPPDKALSYLAGALKKPLDYVQAALSHGPIRIPKAALDPNLDQLIERLRTNGLTVIVTPMDDGMSKTGPVARSSKLEKPPEDWKKGDVIEGIYEVFGSAEGGMGRVYFIFHRIWKMKLAIKTPLRKAIKPDTRLLRFLREAELWVDLGLHPNIATCYYARVISGLPRLFIEYVDGGSLDDWLEKGYLKDLRLIIDLMQQFCHGMLYAEQRGMIHRDIKPANCLITKNKVIKITDFGLVKRVEDPTPAAERENEDFDLTHTGRSTETSVTMCEGGIMGSPRYIAPERFKTQAPEDIRSDIYSFGVMLYELVLRRVPFKLPPKYNISELVRGHLKSPPIDPLSIKPDLPKALAGLMLTCLEKKPDSRYPSFVDVLDELEAVMRELRPGKEPRRRPNLVQLKADSLNNQAVSLLDLGRKDEARALLEDAHSTNTEHLEAVYNLHVQKWITGETSDREVVGRMEALKIETRETPEYNYLMGLISLQRGDPIPAVSYFKRASGEGSPYQDSWEDYGGNPKNFVKSLKLGPIGEFATLAGHIKAVKAVRFAATPGRIYSLGEDRIIRVWDVESARCLKHFRASNFTPMGGAFAPDGDLAAIGYGEAFRILDLWSVSEGKPIRKYQAIGALGLVFSSDSKLLACYGVDRTIRVLETGSDRVVWKSEEKAPKPSCLAFLGASNALIYGDENGALHVVDLRSGDTEYQVALHKGPVVALEVSHDSAVFISGGSDGLINIVETESGKCVGRFSGHRDAVAGVRLSSDGNYLFSVSGDGAIKIWETASGRCFRTILDPREEYTACDISGDGKRLTTGSAKGSVKVWSIDTGWFEKDFLEPAICRPRTFKELARLHGEFNVAIDDFNRSWKKGLQQEALESFEKVRSVPGFCWSKEAVMIRNVLQGAICKNKFKSSSFIRAFHGHTDEVVSLSAGSDGLRLLTGSLDGTAAIWDVVTGRRMRKFVAGHPVLDVLFLPKSKGICAWSSDRVLRMWDLDGNITHEIPEIDRPISLLGNDRDIIALWKKEKPVTVNLSTGELTFAGPGGAGADFSCFSRNGQSLYSIRDSQRVQRWSVTTGRNEGTFRDPMMKITAILPNYSDDKLIAGLENGDILMYHVGSGMNVLNLRGHTAAVRTIACRPEGDLWLSGSDDCSVRLWDLPSEKCLSVLEGHTAPIKAVCFFANIFMLATASADGSARLWGLEWDVSIQKPEMTLDPGY